MMSRINPKRVYRLYRELGLQLQNKTPKRRVKAKLRDDRQPATRANQTWARPHSAIGNKAPIELIDRSVAHGPP